MIMASVVLAAALVAVVWQGSGEWKQAEARRAALVKASAKAAPAPPPPVVPPAPPPASAVAYADVAEKNLFAKDRNPNIVIEQKPQEEKKMPPLPSLYGVMGLPSGVQALMAESRGREGRPVRAGDTVGEFKVLALDTQNVTFGWNGKEIARKVEELIDHSGPVGGPGPAAPRAAAAGPAAPPPPPLQASNTASSGKHGAVSIGTAVEPAYNCLPNDTSPAGTVDDGYRKTVLPSPFGSMCKWVAIR